MEEEKSKIINAWVKVPLIIRVVILGFIISTIGKEKAHFFKSYDCGGNL